MTDVPIPADPLETLLAHREWVRRVARALARDDDDAAEIEQTAWLAAVSSPPPSAGAPRAWLATVLRRATSKIRRGESRRARREEAAARREAVPSVEESVAMAECHERVVRAVLALPEPYRSTVVLRYFEDLPPREIAARAGVPLETVRTRLRRAHELLRDVLRGDRHDVRAVLAPLLAERPVAGPADAAAAGLTASLLLKGAAAAVLAIVAVAAADSVLRAPAPGEAESTSDARSPAESGASPLAAGSALRRPRRADGAAANEAPGGDEEPAGPEPMGEVAVAVERDAAPLPDVLVVVHDHTETVAKGRTGPDGRVRVALAASRLAPGLGLVFVPRDGAPGTALVETGRETRVSLDGGARIEGIVRVDGAAPGEPIALTLQWSAPRFDVSAVPQPVWDALEKDGVTPTSVTAACDASGRFGFLAPRDEALDLEIDEHFQWTDWTAQVSRLRAPRSGLVLDATRLPSVRGRVVDADGRTPLPGAELRITIADGVEGSSSMTCSRSAGAEGRFDIAFPGPHSRLVQMRVAGPDGRGQRSVDLPDPIPSRWDAGDVPIGRTRRVEFVVTRTDGTPVEAAVAYAEEASSSPSVASDAEGRGSVLLPMTACRLRVAAPGFEVAVADVQANAADPVRVALVPGAQLVVTTPSVKEGMRVRLESEAAMFTGPGGQFDSALAAAQCPFPFESTFSSGGPSSADFDCRSGAPLAIDGVREHVRIRVSLVDALGFVAACAETELAPRERREITLKSSSEPRTLRGRVLLPDGRPAAGASVRLAAAGPGGDGIPVDVAAGDDGRFALDGVCAAEVRALVQHEGAAPAVSPLKAADGEKEAVIELAPGRTVRVFVADASGRAVEDAEVGAFCSEFGDWGCGGVNVTAEPQGRGVYVLTGLPAGACAVTATTGEGRGTTQAAAGDTEVRVVLAPEVESKDR